MIAWFYAYALNIQTFPFLFLLYWLVTTKEVLVSQVGYVMYWPQGSFWSADATWGLTLLALSSSLTNAKAVEILFPTVPPHL